MPAGQSRFHVVQKITPIRNTYRIFTDNRGEPGQLVGYAAQKRFAFRESFTVYADEGETQPVLGVSADRRLDVRSVMHVTDLRTGEHVGSLRKKGAASILRSTWELEQPGMPLVVITERSVLVALLRRIWVLIPVADWFPAPIFQFDGKAHPDVPVLSCRRRWTIRDHYLLTLLTPRVDPRLAIALAICLDAMQHR